MVYASSVLRPDVAYLGSGTLFLFKIVSSLVVAVPLIDRVGLRSGLCVGMLFACVYVGGFTLATGAVSRSLEMLIFLIASISGGIAAGIFWTAQGGYLSYTTTAISVTEQTKRQSVSIALASRFAFEFLIFEEAARIMFSILLSRSFSAGQIGCMFTFLGLASTLAMSHGKDVESVQKSAHSALGNAFRAIYLWADYRLWLLSLSSFTFGLSAAYMNGYFNAIHAKPELGVNSIGYLNAFSVIISMCLIPCYYFLGTRCGNGIPIFLGAASFASLAALLLWAHCCTHWGLRILIFYVLQGSGRAVFESTVKAVFCDSFKGDDADAAFANIFFVQALASALCFFMSASLGGQQLAIMVLVFALLTPVGYIAKIYLDTRNASESSPLIEEDKRVV